MTEPQEKIIDYFNYADGYFEATKLLIPKDEHKKYVAEYASVKDRVFRVGPVFQNLGLATELSFKTALLISGKSHSDIRKLNHDLQKHYHTLRDVFDLAEIEQAVFQAATIVGPPANMLKRLENMGENPENWFNLSSQIRALDSNYSHFEDPKTSGSNDHYRARYPANDRVFKEVCVAAIMAGLDVLLFKLATELNQRLSNNCT